MVKTVTEDAISLILANPRPDSSSDLPEIIVQVLDLEPTWNKYKCVANDGKTKVRALLLSGLSSEVLPGKIQNLGLIQVLDYNLIDIPAKNEKVMIILKCEAVSPALEEEYKAQSKIEPSKKQLKRKQRTKEGGSSSIDERWDAKLTIECKRYAQRERLIAIQENAVRIDQERNQIEKERVEMEIMARDTSRMDEIHAAYWNKKKTEILKKNGLI